MARLGRRHLPVLRAAPPVAPAFLVPGAAQPGLASARYFVGCGTIEPRKHHALLLRVWRRLAAERGTDAPKLVVVGNYEGGAIRVAIRDHDRPPLCRIILLQVDADTVERVLRLFRMEQFDDAYTTGILAWEMNVLAGPRGAA